MRLGVKDDRIRRPLRPYTVAYRMMIRLMWSLFLLILSVPGLVLWLPVFLTTVYCVHNFKKTGPIWDTWDEIAQYKLIYGSLLVLLVWLAHSKDVLRFAVGSVRLVWGHIGNLALRKYNFLRYTSTDVDDPPVRLLKISEPSATHHEQVVRGCNCGVPRFRLTAPAPPCR